MTATSSNPTNQNEPIAAKPSTEGNLPLQKPKQESLAPEPVMERHSAINPLWSAAIVRKYDLKGELAASAAEALTDHLNKHIISKFPSAKQAKIIAQAVTKALKNKSVTPAKK